MLSASCRLPPAAPGLASEQDGERPPHARSRVPQLKGDDADGPARGEPEPADGFAVPASSQNQSRARSASAPADAYPRQRTAERGRQDIQQQRRPGTAGAARPAPAVSSQPAGRVQIMASEPPRESAPGASHARRRRWSGSIRLAALASARRERRDTSHGLNGDLTAQVLHTRGPHASGGPASTTAPAARVAPPPARPGPVSPGRRAQALRPRRHRSGVRVAHAPEQRTAAAKPPRHASAGGRAAFQSAATCLIRSTWPRAGSPVPGPDGSGSASGRDSPGAVHVLPVHSVR